MNADNIVILNGRLVKDVDLTYTQTGKAFARFTLAINRSFSNHNGEREADFHQCIAFDQKAENIAKYFQKGSRIGVIGELRDNHYTDNNGVQHFGKQIVVTSFSFRDSKKKESPKQNTVQQPHLTNQTPDSTPLHITDDELPF